MPTGQEPAEGGRKTIERELARQQKAAVDNPARNAQQAGDSQSKPAEPQGQNPNLKLEHPQRGN